MNKHKQAAFTLLEMLVTLVIAAILITIGTPEMKAYMVNQKLTTQTNLLVKHMSLARSEAITRNTQQGVTLTAKSGTAGDWTSGWWTWEDGLPPLGSVDSNRSADEVIRETEAVADIQIYARDAATGGNNVSSLAYRSDGMLRNTSEVHFFICHAGGERPGRHLRVRLTGRISLQNDEYTGTPCP